MTIEQYYLLLLVSFSVTLIAQILVKSRYNKYKQVSNKAGVNGENIARKILEENGMQNVKVIPIKGNLTDNYNPSTQTVSLSEDIFYGTTIAGIAVAAHECGHAIQHHQNHPLIRIRTSLVPLLSITSKLSYLMIVIGYLFGMLNLFEIGIILESLAVLFHLITLPVEFDASKKGLKQLKDFGIFDNTELSGCTKMLTAAALTYVGAALSAITNLLRLILILNNSKERRR